MKNKTLISGAVMGMVLAVMVLALVSCGGGKSGCGGGGASSDPLKDKARQDYSEARRLFLTCNPDNYPKSIELFQKSLGYWDDNPEALAGLAEAISMYYGFAIPEKEFQRAYMSAQRAVRLDPNLDMGYRAMADLFRHRADPASGKPDATKALDVINLAVEKNPRSAENLYVKGSIFLSIDPEKAREILFQAQQLNPNLAKIYFNLASAHQILGDAARGRAEKGEDADKNRDLFHAHYRQAIKFLQKYQEIVPADLAAYCSLGILYFNQDQTAEAEEMFSKTLTVNPNPDPVQIQWRMLALMHLARLADKKGDYKGARLFLDRGLDLAPKDINFLFMAIEMMDKAGDKEAKAQYETRRKQVIEEMKNPPAPEGEPAAGGTAEKETPPPGPGPGPEPEKP